MSPYSIAPRNPVVPAVWNRPFHALRGGIQISKPIDESLDGVATPWTRQKAGSFNPGAPGREPGTGNGPAATSEALFNVASCNARRDRSAHVAFCEARLAGSVTT